MRDNLIYLVEKLEPVFVLSLSIALIVNTVNP